MHIGEWIVMHRLLKVDGIKDLHPVSILYKCVTHFIYHCAFWKRFVKNNMVSIAKITQKKGTDFTRFLQGHSYIE